MGLVTVIMRSLTHIISLHELHKMPIYRQTLSKQGGGAKWLTIHTNLPTNSAQCTCSTSIVHVYTNELGKRKATVVSLRPTKRTRSTSLDSLPQEATKNMEVYKISGSPKRKSHRPKQRRIDLTRTIEEG